VPAEDDGVVRAVGDRRADVVLLPQRERLAARDAHEPRDRRDPERERRVQQRRPQDRGQADREDQEREREQHVRDPRDHRVDRAAVVAGDQADRDRDRHREDGRQEAGQDRGARAEDDARERVPAEIVRPQQVLARRAFQQGVEVGLIRGVGRDPAREDRHEHDRDDDHERGHRGRPPQEAPSEDPPPPRPRRQRRNLDVAHGVTSGLPACRPVVPDGRTEAREGAS
jgi:hypothetical protein